MTEWVLSANLVDPHEDQTRPRRLTDGTGEPSFHSDEWQMMWWAGGGEDEGSAYIRTYYREDGDEDAYFVEINGGYCRLALVRCDSFLEVVDVVNKVRVFVDLDPVPLGVIAPLGKVDAIRVTLVDG